MQEIFGSGKTEIALNYSLALQNEGSKVYLADLDIINPYFCVRDEAKLLKEKGIRLISIPREITDAEVSAIPFDANAIFDDKSKEIVIDIGGDYHGAVALGQYNRFFSLEDYDMYFIVNTCRPFTKDADGIIEMLNEIEKASRLKVKYFIHNTNLGEETTLSMILEGQKIMEIVSHLTQIPVKYTTISERLMNETLDIKLLGEVFPLKNIYVATLEEG